MGNEINLIDCIAEITQKTIAMSGNTYVYLDTKKDVEIEIVNEAKELKEQKDLENSKTEKYIEIKKDFTTQESESILIDGVQYQGGYASAIKLDSVKRLNESAGLNEVVFYDAQNNPHELLLNDANNIVITVAGKYQKDFGKYQSLKVDIKNAVTIEQVELIKWQ